MKYLALDPADLKTTIKTLAIVQDALAADAAKHGLLDEWGFIEAHFLLELLMQKDVAESKTI